MRLVATLLLALSMMASAVAESATANTIPKFTAADKIADSRIADDGTTVSVTGASGQGTVTLGAELLSASNWTTTGWSGTWAGGFTHTAGNTTALTNTIAAVIGDRYSCEITLSGRTAGSVTLLFGGVTRADFPTTMDTSPFTWGPTATTTGTLSITPTSDFDGTIVLSLKKATGANASILKLKTSEGTVRQEIRASSHLYNVFFGINSGQYARGSYPYGSNNVGIGYDATANMSTGYNNCAVGTRALRDTTDGKCNTAFGEDALVANISGCDNTAVGQDCMISCTTGGNSNTALGGDAMYTFLTGGRNLAAGNGAFGLTTTGDYNTYLGYASGISAEGSQYATAVGYMSGHDITGANNVCVGSWSGYGNSGTKSLTSGSQNTFVGDNSGIDSGSAQMDNSTAIGYKAMVTASNQVVVGNTSVTETKLRGKVNLVIARVPNHANNAAARAGGLVTGDLYRTGADPDVLCIVHDAP